MEYQTILFKKNPVLFRDEAEALDALRSMKFTMGEPVVAIYGPSWKEAELILAIGKRTAAGETAFDIVATSRDTANINVDITNIKNALKEHEGVLASDDNPGHVISGRYIGYINGYGFVKQLSHKVDFVTSEGTISFNGSQDVSVNIPSPGNSGPKANSSVGSAGNSLNYSREDHVHPVQQTISGNAGSATKLRDPQKIDITGAVLGSTTTDFSGPVTIETSVNHTHPSSEITDIQDIWDELETKAPIESPDLSGIPTAPTAPQGTNTTQVATTEFVINEIQDKIEAAIALRYKGTIGTGDEDIIQTLPSHHVTGDTYLCSEGSPVVGEYQTEPGDMIVCIRDSSVASDSDWNVIQGNVDGSLIIGEGLSGNGNLKSGATISHYPKPISGTKEGENGSSFVTDVLVDKFGHISGVEKSNISNRITAGNGQYISGIWINGTNLEGTFGNLPTIQINDGSPEQDQFVTGFAVSTNNNSHTINVSKRSLVIPDIELRYADAVSGQYVSGFTSLGHTINVLRTNFPAESGKVKVSENGQASYLSNKLISDNTGGNKYGVNITPGADTLKLGVIIENIDGNNNQSIKLKRGNTPGESGENSELGEGEIFINTSDLFLYVDTGDSGIKRLYPLVSNTSPGLMSPEDKEKLDKASSDIGDVGNISLILSTLEQELNKKINNVNTSVINLNQQLTTETTERINKDTSLESNINSLDSSVVKRIQLGTGNNSSIITPINGLATIPKVTSKISGIVTPDEWTQIYTKLPQSINDIKTSINSYTVNKISISRNPVIGGNNSYITGYSQNSSGEWPSGEDLINTAIAKLEYHIKKEINDSNSKYITLDNKLTNETLERKNADDKLQVSISNEISNRQTEISNLKTELTKDIQNQITTLGNDLSTDIINQINSLRNEINNDIQSQIDSLRNEINNNISVRIQELQSTIDGILEGDELSEDFQETHYLSGIGNLVEAFKLLDSKIYEIEQAMLSSIKVKDAD